MDWAGWALFGLVATTALTVVMIAAQLTGQTRLDLPLLLGTIVTEDPDRARVAGFFIHLVIGQGFAFGGIKFNRHHVVDHSAIEFANLGKPEGFVQKGPDVIATVPAIPDEQVKYLRVHTPGG